MSAVSHAPPNEESFGRRLRRERERRQIALASIAENTKIGIALFQDLERDDVSRWPSGIYRRAFIRAYADAVGVDVDATMRDFLERFPDPNDPDRIILSAEALAQLAQDPAGAHLDAPDTHKPIVASTLRLTLADTSTSSFVRGRLLPSVKVRFAAIACDAAIVATVGLALYTVLGTLWMPLCLALVGYYGGGILLLGNTPGVCLCTSAGGTNPPSGGGRQRRAIRAYAATILGMLTPHTSTGRQPI